MSLISDLRTLQEIDDEVATLEAALADVDARLTHSSELQSAEEGFAAADARLQAARRAQRDLESAIADLTAKIQPEEKRLYDGSVRSPKELTAIQHEVEHLRAKRAELEDRLLDAMAEFEAASVHRAETEARLHRARAARDDELQQLRRRRDEQALRLTNALARRQTLAAGIPSATLRRYDDIRQRRGHAIARIQGSSCTGCRVAIPESVRRKAFDPSALAQCPNCERILFVG